MSNPIYKKTQSKNTKKIIRSLGLAISICSLILGIYIFSPIISWALYLQPVFANNSFTSPIPNSTIITKNFLKNFVNSTTNTLSGIDYSDATNWLPPNYKYISGSQQIPSYTLSIPSLNIADAIVSTTDTDLSKHLIQYPGTAIPTSRGTSVVFGHSTIPVLYDRNNYKTIFANIHKLKIGDSIITKLNNKEYTYKIFNMEITDPENTSYLVQNYDASYLTIVTCTPPGSVAFRLFVKARLEGI